MNVHQTFRRCPGRLLNVLGTLSLRPVPRELKLLLLKLLLRLLLILYIAIHNITKKLVKNGDGSDPKGIPIIC